MKGDILFWSTNPEWYDYDENEEPYLTEKAPLSAHESFKKYREVMEAKEKTRTRTV